MQDPAVLGPGVVTESEDLETEEVGEVGNRVAASSHRNEVSAVRAFVRVGGAQVVWDPAQS